MKNGSRSRSFWLGCCLFLLIASAGVYDAASASPEQEPTANDLYNLLNQAYDALARQQYAAAREILEQARALANRLGDEFAKGISLKLLGDVARLESRLRRALECYQQAEAELEKARQADVEGSPAYHITALASLANTYTDLSLYHDALRFYQKALRLLSETADPGDQPLRAKILRDYGTAASRLVRSQEALERSQQALTLFQELEDAAGIVAVLTTIGGVYEEWGQRNAAYFLKALSVYADALQIGQQHTLERDQAIILNNLGKVLDRLGWQTRVPAYHRQALEYYRQSQHVLHRLTALLLKGRVWQNRGLAHLHLSFYEDSARHLREAVAACAHARNIQDRIQDRAGLWMTLSTLGWAYQLEEKPAEALEYSQKAIKVFEEIMASARVEELKISLRNRAEAAYMRAILLSYTTGRLEQAFEYSERARARAFLDLLGNTRPAPTGNIDAALLQQQQDLQRELAEIEYHLRTPAEQPEPENPTEEVETLRARLTDIRQQYEQLRLKIKLNNPEYAALLSIAPLSVSDLQRALPPDVTLLSYVVTPQVTLAISAENVTAATETRFKALAGEHGIVHLAAHGRLEPETPLFSSIALSPDSENDGRLEVHELYDLSLDRTKLVVLSACETQLGRRSRGDDIIGLTRAFLYAGASSVIASLWKVDDQATCDLMTHFYRHLALTHSPARALRAAQRITRHTYPHPYYWAGFVLTGLP